VIKPAGVDVVVSPSTAIQLAPRARRRCSTTRSWGRPSRPPWTRADPFAEAFLGDEREGTREMGTNAKVRARS